LFDVDGKILLNISDIRLLILSVHPSGIEPEPTAPETVVLSIILWVLLLKITLIQMKARSRNMIKTIALHKV
tara:strand:- start:1408 stop:1623 length:216 start_codon:yes stop_codon:yes gene_type:complete